MRLIHTTTLKPHDFFSSQVPPYAILSHRWEAEEVTYQELESGNGTEKKGWAKVLGCCARAASDGWEYAWIDSCCIDKTSSAELSEAINSMFKWYRSSQICYVYMSDVKIVQRDMTATIRTFQQSLWFTRGWTLQELLAPLSLEFYDQDWDEVGTKSSLIQPLSKVTGISVEHLWGFSLASVAQKMSWAARRVTTRLEDEAYCLLGLFDVQMPPLYGEGKAAFARLQLEIMNRYEDETLFAWEAKSLAQPHDTESIYLDGLLAFSASNFENSGNIEYSRFLKRDEAPKMTNQGLSINFWLEPADNWPEARNPSHKDFVVPLNCVRYELRQTESGPELFEVQLSIRVRRFNGGDFYRYNETLRPWDNTPQLRKGNSRTVFFSQYRGGVGDFRRSQYAGYIISVDYTAVEALGFVLEEPEQPEQPLLLSTSTNTNGQTPKSKLIFEDQCSQPNGMLTFRRIGYPSLTLIYCVLWRSIIIDLVTSIPNKTVEKFSDLKVNAIEDEKYEKCPDRVSIKMAENCYISAILKRRRDPETGKSVGHIQLSVDEFERWIEAHPKRER